MQPLLLVLIPVAFWFLLINPQRRRVRVQQALLTNLVPGDEVITSGGIIGRIVTIGEQEVTVEIAPSTIVRVARMAIVGCPAQEDAAPRAVGDPEDRD